MLKLKFFSSGAENVERVLVTVIQGAVEYPDPIAQKTCFIILSKLVELWGKIILFLNLHFPNSFIKLLDIMEHSPNRERNWELVFPGDELIDLLLYIR